MLQYVASSVASISFSVSSCHLMNNICLISINCQQFVFQLVAAALPYSFATTASDGRCARLNFAPLFGPSTAVPVVVEAAIVRSLALIYKELYNLFYRCRRSFPGHDHPWRHRDHPLCRCRYHDPCRLMSSSIG